MSISGGDCLTAINGILCWQGGLPHRAHCGTQAFPLFQDQIYLRTRHSMQFGLQEVMNNLSSCFLRPHLEYAFSEVSMSGGEKKSISIISSLSFIFIKCWEEQRQECYEPRSGPLVSLIHESVREKVQICAVSSLFTWTPCAEYALEGKEKASYFNFHPAMLTSGCMSGSHARITRIVWRYADKLCSLVTTIIYFKNQISLFVTNVETLNV